MHNVLLTLSGTLRVTQHTSALYYFPLLHWSIITFWLHPDLSMTSAPLSDSLAAPCTHKHSRLAICMPTPHVRGMHVNVSHTSSHLRTDRHRRSASVWADIILGQYNSVSEPKHKLGSCWKTLLRAGSCLCVCFWGLPDGNEPHWPSPPFPFGFPVFCCSN